MFEYELKLNIWDKYESRQQYLVKMNQQKIACFNMLYCCLEKDCIVLSWVVLCCIVLYCILLYHIVLYFSLIDLYCVG